MQKILRKRIFRDLRKNVFRYLALGLLVVLGMYLIVSLVGAADTVIKGSAGAEKKNRIEDGQFALFAPLTEAEENALEKEGITLEAHFSLDYPLEDGSVLRVFSERENIDLAQADSGHLPEKTGEIFLEKRYCEENSIAPGDEIVVGGHRFTVCGSGSSPDYNTPYRELSDSAVDSGMFGVGFVCREEYELLRGEQSSVRSEEYVYAYRLNGKVTKEELKEKLQNLEMETGDTTKYDVALSKLIQFIPAADNVRIGGAADDQFINKAAGLAAGVIVLVLFAYVISVFVVHNIEQEAGIIGTLYAMGVRRSELMRHYLTLPVLITLVGGVIGTMLGYSPAGIHVQMLDVHSYFSIPDLDVVCEPYLLVYGIVMPPVAAALTNYLVIRKKLERPALSLIRNEQKAGRTQKVKINVGSFVHIFQIRQFLRETRTAFTVFFGMFISLLIVMLAMNCYVLCRNIKIDSNEDTKFAYMYTYKYPEQEVPEGGVAACGMKLKKEIMGYNLEVTLLGIDKDNPYFEIQTDGDKVFDGKNRVQISSSMADKYHLREGDDLVLKDEENGVNYAFTIEAIVPYATSFFAFMDIESMRELLGEDSEYYNVVFADDSLDIDSSRIYSSISKEEIEKNSAIFGEKMMGLVVTLTIASALIFAVVMYLMMKVMVDRSAMSISLLKVFGYRKKEIRRLYLNGNLLVVVVSALIGIPLSKFIMDDMYPYLISNVACGINLTFPWQLYVGLFAGILLLYFLINGILMRRVNRILPAEVLKNRE